MGGRVRTEGEGQVVAQPPMTNYKSRRFDISPIFKPFSVWILFLSALA